MIGERLALLARNQIYGEKPACRFRSPLLQSAVRTGDRVVLTFANTEDGLAAKDRADGRVVDLMLVGADGALRPANAQVDKQTVVLDVTGEKTLPDVYYAWGNYPAGNLYNAAGMPASPFRLVTPRLTIVSCTGTVVKLKCNASLGEQKQKAEQTSTYAVTGARVTGAALTDHGWGVDLTLSQAPVLGATVRVSFPGLRGWDGVATVADAVCTAGVAVAVAKTPAPTASPKLPASATGITDDFESGQSLFDGVTVVAMPQPALPSGGKKAGLLPPIAWIPAFDVAVGAKKIVIEYDRLFLKSPEGQCRTHYARQYLAFDSTGNTRWGQENRFVLTAAVAGKWTHIRWEVPVPDGAKRVSGGEIDCLIEQPEAGCDNPVWIDNVTVRGEGMGQ